MALYAIGERTPTIHPTAFVHPDAVIIGDVIVGAEASIWPTAVLRGDTGQVVVGAQTSIQDGSVLHCTDTMDTIIGARCVIGHRAHLEGCTIEDDSLVGSGSVVLHGAVVRTGGMVAAQALVSPGTEVPSGRGGHGRAGADQARRRPRGHDRLVRRDLREERALVQRAHAPDRLTARHGRGRRAGSVVVGARAGQQRPELRGQMCRGQPRELAGGRSLAWPAGRETRLGRR